MRALFPVVAVALLAATATPLAAQTGTVSPPQAPVPGIAELGVTMKRAQALDAAGQYRRAERLWREALDRRIALLGANDPLIAQAYGRLASNLEDQGRWPEAETLRLKAVALFERQSRDAVDTGAMGMAVSGLARNQQQQGRIEEATTTAYRAFSILKEKGDDSLDAAWGYNGVGSVLMAQEAYQRARIFYRPALEIRRRLLGERDPDTATSYNNLGTVLARLGRIDEALPLLRHALSAREAVDSVGSMTAQSALNLGIALDMNDRSAQATPYLEQARAILRARNGEKSVPVAAADNALGLNAYHLKHLDDAERRLRSALRIREQKLGRNHADTGESYANLAVVLDGREQHQAALRLHDKGLAIRKAASGPDAVGVADSLANRAACYSALSRRNDAWALTMNAVADYEAAYRIYLAKLGPDHPRTIAAEAARRSAARVVVNVPSPR